MTDGPKGKLERLLAELFVTHGFSDLQQAHLGTDHRLRVTLSSTSHRQASEGALVVLHRLRKMGILAADSDQSEYKEQLPQYIDVKLLPNLSTVMAIENFLRGEDNPLARLHERRIEEIVDIFSDNDQEFDFYSEKATENEAVDALSAHFKSVTGIIFNTSDIDDRSEVKVAYYPATKQPLARSCFMIEYGRKGPHIGGFFSDNALVVQLERIFKRSSGLPESVVRACHDANTPFGSVIVKGNPHRLFHELRLSLLRS